MVHSKTDETKWEESTLEPIAIVGMGKQAVLACSNAKPEILNIKQDVVFPGLSTLPPPSGNS